MKDQLPPSYDYVLAFPSSEQVRKVAEAPMKTQTVYLILAENVAAWEAMGGVIC